MTEILRWGILGSGNIASKFAAELSACPRGELVAVGSRSAASATRFAEQFPCTAHPSYEALLSDENVDAVYVSLPNSLHAPWSIQALEAGKHVLCEKPIAATATEAEAMFAAADRAGRVLVEAFMYRSIPAVGEMIRMAHDGAVGKLKLIRTHFTFHRAASLEDVRYQRDLAGGALMDVGCYCINLARALARTEPSQLYACGQLHEGGVDEYSAGTLRFPEGILASFTCGMTVEADRTTYVCGSDGYLAMPSPWFSEGSFTLIKGDKTETFHFESPRGAYAMEAAAFAQVVYEKQAPSITRADSIGNMRVLDTLRTMIGLPY